MRVAWRRGRWSTPRFSTAISSHIPSGGRLTSRGRCRLSICRQQARVAIIGGGYGGLSTALELAARVSMAVLEATSWASAPTRNGGGVSGGVNVGKGFRGKAVESDRDRALRGLSDAADAFAWSPPDARGKHRLPLAEERPLHRRLDAAALRRAGAPVETSTTRARIGTYMVPREQQREEIASDYYYGGMVVERTGQLHPALYYGGLLERRRPRGRGLRQGRRREDRAQGGSGWRVRTNKGPDRGARGGDRDQRLHRRPHADAEARGWCRWRATSSPPRNCPRTWSRA